MPIRAGVAVDRCTCAAGDSGHGFQTAEAAGHSEIDKVLEDGSGFNVDSSVFGPNGTGSKAEDDTAITGVVDDEVCAIADNAPRQTAASSDLESLSKGS